MLHPQRSASLLATAPAALLPMLAPRASSAFVCLRCELHLARPRLSAFARRAPHAPFSTSGRRRDALDEPADELKPRPQLSEYPLGRLRKRKGERAVRATTAHLDGTKTLGEDAAILVLKEVGEAPRAEEEKTPPEIIGNEADRGPEIMQSLGQPSATLDEIVKQIDSLRPNEQTEPDEPHYVRQAVFMDLAAHLLRAFTGQQLSHYYSVMKGVKEDCVVQEVMHGVKQLQSKVKRPAERSAWHPGTTDFKRRLPGLDVHKVKRKAISKHLVVDQILRDVWKLVLLEEIEAAGELEIVLKDWQLALLTSGATQTPLDRIGVARKAKLETHAGDSILRITADKHTAEYAADDVEQLLAGSESSRFKIASWLPHLETPRATINDIFTKEALQTVATMTGAYVQPTSNSIIIRAFDKDTTAEAERCLIKMLPLKQLVGHSIDITGMNMVGQPQYLAPVTFDKEAVPHTKREANLGRWSLPAKRSNNVQSRLDAVDPRIEAAQNQIIKLTTQTKEAPSAKAAKGHKWHSEPEIRLRAKFGHALFPLDSSQTAPDSTMPYFLPAFPGLSTVLSDESFKMNFYTLPALDYEFIAAPLQHTFGNPGEPEYPIFPKLNIKFSTDWKTREHKLHKVVLEFDQALHDVLLPEQAVDVQFEVTKNLYMADAATDTYMREFAAQVLANIQSGERLNAPQATLDVPLWTIPGFGTDGDRKKTRPVKFLFTGIRFQQSVWGEYMGRTVNYSTAQSGKLGRKGGQFAAVYGLDARSNKTSIFHDEVELKTFVEDCFQLAGSITKAAAVKEPTSKKPEMMEAGHAPKRSTERASKKVAATDRPVTADSRGEGVAAEVSDNDVPIAQAPQDETRSSLDDPEIVPTAAGHETKASSQEDARIPDNMFEDPYLSSVLNDNPFSHDNRETQESMDGEEQRKEEQKRRLESAA